MKHAPMIVVGIVMLSVLGITIMKGASAVVSGSEADHPYTAGAYQNFSRSAYDLAVADGKTVILDFHADWCPTCRANEPVISRAFGANTNTNIVGFKVNYDREAALKRLFGVTSQSTIVKTIGGEKVDQLGPGLISDRSFGAFIRS